MAGSPTEPQGEAAPGYVLVPVPAELAHDVGQEVLRLQWQKAGVARPWPLDAIVELLVTSDDLVTSMVRLAARSELTERDLVDVELAERLGVNSRELAGLIREVNDTAPPGVLDLVVLHRVERGGTLVREVRMIGEHARRVEEAVAIARRRLQR